MGMTEAARIRRQLAHPVLDCDGHWVESAPVFMEYLREVAGPQLTDQFRSLSLQRAGMRWVKASAEDRANRRLPQDLGAGNAGTLDVATAMLPALMSERMQELG